MRLWVTNNKDETIELTNSPYFDNVEVDLLGLKATVNKDRLSNADGSIYNSSYVADRTVQVIIEPTFPVEENRQRIYKYFKVKKPVTLRFSNGNRDVKLIGYVNEIDGSLFEMKQKMIVNMECLNPYFQDLKQTIISMSQIVDMFEFPFSTEEEGIVFSEMDKTQTTLVFNAGDIETGMIIELTASGKVVNPVVYNSITRESIGLQITMESGDIIRIYTEKKNRKIELIRDGITSNIINYLMKNPDWLQLESGDNVFTYRADSGEELMFVKFIYTNQYEGV